MSGVRGRGAPRAQRRRRSEQSGEPRRCVETAPRLRQQQGQRNTSVYMSRRMAHGKASEAPLAASYKERQTALRARIGTLRGAHRRPRQRSRGHDRLPSRPSARSGPGAGVADWCAELALLRTVAHRTTAHSLTLSSWRAAVAPARVMPPRRSCRRVRAGVRAGAACGIHLRRRTRAAGGFSARAVSLSCSSTKRPTMTSFARC